MSKKLYSTIYWKERSRRRQEDQVRDLRRSRSRKRTIRRERVRKRTLDKRGYTTITAPSIFSFVKNPEGVIEFLRKVKSEAGQYHLEFDLRQITVMTSDTVAAFIATLGELGATKVRGNLPTDEKAKQMLLESGFFDHVKTTEKLPSVARGRIAQWRSKRVEPRFAQGLIHEGTKGVFGAYRHQPASYRVLIEGMTNTRNHAAESTEEKQTWWAMVYADTESQRVCYTILDMGIGIFRSVKVRGVRKIYRNLHVTDNSDILKDILEGRVESSTGEKYRGKGLPAMFTLSRAQRIHSLIIITNNVYADVDKGEFRLLPLPFVGTLLYWEN